MDGLDWVGVAAAFTLATGVSYALMSAGRGKGKKSARPQRRPVPPPSGTNASPSAPPVAPPTVPSVAPASAAVTSAAAASPVQLEPNAEKGMVRLEYEEDDEIDPTRVGGHSARVKGGRLQPPVQKIVYDDEAQTDEPTQAESLFLVSATAHLVPF